MKLYLNSKQGKHSAIAEYDGKTVTVLKGSKINLETKYSRLQQFIIDLRNDPSIVSMDGTLSKDITFSTPTTAAQFVTGRSVNGYIAWRPDNSMSLKEYIARKE